MKKLTLFIFFSLLVQNILAQQTEKEEFQLRAKWAIENFQMHLATIISKAVSEASKDKATASALELFIGKGQSYEYADDYGNRRIHEPVKMRMSNRYRKYAPVLMTQYLKKLRNLTYTKVEIEAVDAVRVENIIETNDGKYEAIAYFCQKFYGYKDGRLVYSDITEKKIKIYVEKEVIPTSLGTNQVTWIVLLGDVYAIINY